MVHSFAMDGMPTHRTDTSREIALHLHEMRGHAKRLLALKQGDTASSLLEIVQSAIAGAEEALHKAAAQDTPKDFLERVARDIAPICAQTRELLAKLEMPEPTLGSVVDLGRKRRQRDRPNSPAFW